MFKLLKSTLVALFLALLLLGVSSVDPATAAPPSGSSYIVVFKNNVNVISRTSTVMINPVNNPLNAVRDITSNGISPAINSSSRVG